jgi:YVTN family beta-propeller protein
VYYPLSPLRRAACLVLGLVGLQAAATATTFTRQWEEEGMRFELSLVPAGSSPSAGGEARLQIKLAAAHDGAALSGRPPGAWVDIQTQSADIDDERAQQLQCGRQVARFLSPSLTSRAWADLNGYHVLTLNEDASVSVFDPQTQFAGKTSLRASFSLPSRGFDWVQTEANDRLFITLPETQQLAIADLDRLRVEQTVKVPGSPGRVRLQPDGKRLWIGIPRAVVGRARSPDPTAMGGVVVIQATAPYAQRFIPTGNGHHEFAFDPLGLVAVTNRDSGSVSFVDPTTLTVVRSTSVGPAPLSAVFDAASRRFIVAEAAGGALHFFNVRGEPEARLALSPGIGPMQVSPDGAWLLVLNASAHRVDVIDLAGGRAAHSLPVSGRPFEVTFTSAYAYVRALDTESVTLIQLASLRGKPLVQRFSAGERPPGLAANLPIAGQFAPMPDDSGSFVLDPADNAVHVYMQGMNAPASSLNTRGHPARAVAVARRGLREVERGTYEIGLTLPPAARALVAVATDSPRTRRCFVVDLAPSSTEQRSVVELHWESLPTGQSQRIAFRLSGRPVEALPDQLPLVLHEIGMGRRDAVAQRQADGIYVSEVSHLPTGVFYVHAIAPRGLLPAGQSRWPYASFER